LRLLNGGTSPANCAKKMAGPLIVLMAEQDAVLATVPLERRRSGGQRREGGRAVGRTPPRPPTLSEPGSAGGGPRRRRSPSGYPVRLACRRGGQRVERLIQ